MKLGGQNWQDKHSKKAFFLFYFIVRIRILMARNNGIKPGFFPLNDQKVCNDNGIWNDELGSQNWQDKHSKKAFFLTLFYCSYMHIDG